MIDIVQAPPTKLSEEIHNVYSQFGEDGVIDHVLSKIGTTNKQCFEVGAADGKWFSNTRRLIDKGWQACLIEADPANWPELDKLEEKNPRVQIVHGKAEPVGPNSLDSILQLAGFSEKPDLGVIDVDGQDYYLWNAMTYKPRVMVVEYDSSVPPEFVPDLGGEGQASFAAICSIAVSKGYINVAVTPTNGIFVLRSETEKLFANKPLVATSEDIGPMGAHGDPVIETPKAQEIKIVALLSRPRFGLNVFWDCASEALAPWHIPIQSFYGVFWDQCMQTGMEDNINAGVDWILTLDYDTLFTSKHVQQLIDALGQFPEIDAICGLQVRRGRPLPLAVRSDGEMKLTGGPVQATTAHFGLTIFRAASFKKLKKPWFVAKPTPAGDWREGRLDPDIYFWGNWRDCGNTLYVHTGCRIGHVEEMASEFDPDGKVQHKYLSQWRKDHGHSIRTFE
jgi:hypothetical protein